LLDRINRGRHGAYDVTLDEKKSVFPLRDGIVVFENKRCIRVPASYQEVV